MDCPHRMPPSGTPVHHHRSHSQHRYPTRSTSCHHHEDRYKCSRSRSQSHHQRYHSQSHHDSTEAILVCTTGATDNITEVIHDAHTQILISTVLTMTLHIEGHLHIGAHQFTYRITAYHTLNQPTGQLRKPCIQTHQIPEDPKVIHTLEEIQESQ